jgi:hypothetical protein
VGIRDAYANDEVQSISPSDLSTGPSISLIAIAAAGDRPRKSRPLLIRPVAIPVTIYWQ